VHAAATGAPGAAACAAAAVANAASKPKQTRVNWSKGDNAMKLSLAVAEWTSNTGRAAPREFLGETEMRKPSLGEFATMVDIPKGTLGPYVTSTNGKARVLGSQVGTRPHLNNEEKQFVVDNIRRADRGNDGMSKKRIVDMVQDIKPDLSRTQAEAALKSVREEHKGELTAVVKAQATTTKRTAITVSQQYRWYMCVESVLNELRKHNTGPCKLTGKMFGEVFDQFIFGGDETCLLASSGDVNIIGDKAKKKHEAKVGDSRVSITMYRLGSVAGVTGPTGFLMAGQKRKPGFTDEFLLRNGAAEGSSIHMTPTGFMTEEAWIEMTPFQIKGIKSIPIVAANPDWKVVEILDGFGAHFSSPEALQMKADAGIICVKEEADSSHVCQGYDKYVAKCDKAVMRSTLDLLRRTTAICKGVVDQWGLVHVGLAAVRAVKPSVWIESFKACDLNPHHRVSFEAWCQRIASDLRAGQQFKQGNNRV
jgi:hypothetical protein